MMDIGCYALHWLRSIMGGEPEILSAEGTRNPLGVDESMRASMRFPDGTPAEMVVDMARPPFHALLRIEGEKGAVEFDNPCAPHVGHSIREWLDGEPYREHTVAGGTTYEYQLAAMIEAVESGAPPVTGGIDPLGNMAAIDAIYAKSGIR
jgi:predicted dehydrogenase